MERDISALQNRLIHESDIKPEILLYAIFDCILDQSIDTESDLMNSNALRIISNKLSAYYNQSQKLDKPTFEQAIRSDSILDQMEKFYTKANIKFDKDHFKETWPNTLEDLDAPWSFIDHMTRTKAQILKIPAREKHQELLNKTQLKIIFLRHSTKGPDGNITEEGKEKAKNFTLQSDENESIEIFTSDIQRSIDTGTMISNTNKITKPIVIDPILSEYPYTDEKIEELGLSGGKWLLIDEASKLLADKIAKFTLDAIENNTLGKKEQILAISHVPPIMAFLGYLFAYVDGKNCIDEEVRSQLLESFNGFVRPLEGFELTYYANNEDFVQVAFTNQSLQIPISVIKNLVI